MKGQSIIALRSFAIGSLLLLLRDLARQDSLIRGRMEIVEKRLWQAAPLSEKRAGAWQLREASGLPYGTAAIASSSNP